MLPPRLFAVQGSIDQRIRHAIWVAVVVTSLCVMYEIYMDIPKPHRWALADVALVCGLSYALYRKSRFAALALPLYFMVPALWHGIGLHRGVLLVPMTILAFFLLPASAAVFEDHRRRTPR